MDIRPVTAIATGPQGLDALGASAAPPPAEVRTDSKALDPPVKLDIGANAGDARFIRDTDTKTLVFQVVDPGSGIVIVQSPTESILRNRAYDVSARARTVRPVQVSRVT